MKPHRDSPRAASGPDSVLVRYPTFDGRRIPAFVRRPGPGFRGRRPVLIDIHGGPHWQYTPRWSLLESYLLGELGIAIIHPNVRGSTGYGNTFQELDDGRSREGAVKDIGALLDWVAEQPDQDASRVAVTGGSYGGFMALASMVRYGHRLRAGIDISGVSSFETLLKNAPAESIEGWRGEFGDERDPQTLEYLRSISPLSSYGSIRKPLLVIHGANDPFVMVDEAERIVAALRKNGVPVWYVRFAGEGHGFDRGEHDTYSQFAQILFLRRFLLGQDSA